MTSILRALVRAFFAAMMLALALPAVAAPLASPSDNNLHIDRGVVYSNVVFLSTSGGTAPYTFSFDATKLPVGVSVTSDGFLSGVTCGSNGSFPLGTVTVTDAVGATATDTHATLIVNAAPAGGCSLTVTSSLGAPVVGQAYSGSVTASNGTSPYTYSIASGSLPAGLSLSSGGVVSGTPTAAGSYSFTVLATDASGSTGSTTVTLTVSATATITVSPSSLPAGVGGVAYSQSLSASGGTSPYSYAVTLGSLPSGLTLSSGGTLSGTPSAAGSFNFTVTATDANSATGSRAYTLVIGAALSTTQAVASKALTAGVAATPFTPVTASGGSTPYAFAVSPGLPSGLSFNTGNGQVTGTPSGASASTTYTVTVTDANGSTSSKTFTLAIGAALSTAQVVASASGTAGQAVTPFTPVTASGGSGPYSYAVSPALPAGLSFDTGTGQVSGTPSGTSASTTYTVTVTDANGSTSSKTFGFSVAAPTVIALSPTSLPAGVVGVPYSQNLSASGGTGPYGYAVTAGTLPTGLVLASNGTLSGTPSGAGAATFTITATDAGSATGSRSYTLTIGAALSTAQAVASATLTTGTAVTPFTPVTASGGSGPYGYAISPALPAGLVFDTATGQISGTPSASAASATYTVTVTDANGTTSGKTFTLGASASLGAVVQVGETATVIAEPTAPFTPVVASGGTGPYVYSVGPALPAGLAMDATTGLVSGTPTITTALTTYTVQIVDANGASTTRQFRLSVTVAVALDVQPRSIALPAAGVPFTAALQASGGMAPYRFDIVAGTLPEGLTLDTSTGVISGRARAMGATGVTLRLTDATGATLEVALTVSVGARPDPRNDLTIVALQTAQAEALLRLAGAQLRNVQSRLDQGLECLPELSQQLHLNATWRDARDGAETRPAAPSKAPECSTGPAAWIAGTVDYGRIRGSDERSALKFTSPGLTAGIDFAPMRGLRLGVALGHGQDRTEVGARAGRLDVRADSLTAYGAWLSPWGVRVDAALGQARSTLDLQRTITGDTLVAQGERRARQVYVALGATGRLDLGAWRVAPHVGLQHSTARLDAYTETSASSLALAYDATRLTATDVQGGAKLSRRWPAAGGTLEPELGLDWTRRLQGRMTQGMHYADDVAGTDYALTSRPPASDVAQIGIGLRWQHASGLTLSAGAQATVFGGPLRDAAYSAAARWSF